MSQQPTQSLTGHAVCVRCHPNLDGPAICGAPVNGDPVEGVCEVCSGLAFAPCPVCQAQTWDLWARLMTVEDVEYVAGRLADNENCRDCG